MLKESKLHILFEGITIIFLYFRINGIFLVLGKYYFL